MSAAIAASHFRQKPLLPRQAVLTTAGGAGEGSVFWDITRRLLGRGLGQLDVATLTRLLREAERIQAKSERLLRGPVAWTGAPPGLPRTRNENIGQKASRGRKIRPELAA